MVLASFQHRSYICKAVKSGTSTPAMSRNHTVSVTADLCSALTLEQDRMSCLFLG